ncbi:MAG: relaxase/mobilization nuclease domain-containing protein [Lachnospiraceae bacterium]|nr:relaxase/mobilization nuclease domain-containing protein [Lachnospiraceae bacterium]
MAILKHIANKNADYSEAQRYLIFQHNEYTGKPILDGNGKMQLREEYYLDGVECDPFSFDMECKELNARFHKNQTYDEIKSHHYIISFDPKDRDECGLTGEQAQQFGLEYCKKNFPGHQALVCTHMDGHNGSGNIHVHIVINSLRKNDVERQDFMERNCDSRAGNKHHLTNDYLVYLKQSLMDLCLRENLHQVDLLTKAERKVTEKEYHAKRSGQKKLEERNRQMISEGITPRITVFQTQKEYLRTSIDEAAASAHDLKKFEQILSEKFNIKFKISRGRFSYLHPDRDKPITGKNLGTHYEKDYLMGMIENNSRLENAEKDQTVQKDFLPEEITHDRENSAHQREIPAGTDAPTAPFEKSGLRLVTDLQHCIKAQQSKAYAGKVKLTNLQTMAKTLSYVQEHGYNTVEDAEGRLAEIKEFVSSSRKELKDIEGRLRQTNEQIHYTGQYLANKSIYSQFLKSKNKGQFRQEHSSELALYEAAVKFLKEKSGDGKLPTLQTLKAEKEKLLVQKKEAKEKYHYYRDYQKELNTVCANIHSALGQQHTRPTHKQEREDIS